MSHHPWGPTVKILGIQSPRSCEEHPICGHVLQEDSVVRFRKVQVLIDGKEESAIAAFWVSDGAGRCRVGYLPNIMSNTGSLWKVLLHRLQRSTLKTVRVPQNDRSITGIQVVQLEHSSLHLCLSVHHHHPRKNAKNTKHAKHLLNKNQKRRTSKMKKKYNIWIKIESIYILLLFTSGNQL